jgi:protoporphyrinogen oxidase
MTDRRRFVVLGAGLAGLSAADVLASRGCSVVVLEKAPSVGGLASTVRSGDSHFDYGPHRFHTKNPAVLARVRGLLGGDLLQLERISRIRLLDRYFRYPLSLGDVMRRMPLHRGAAMLGSYACQRVARLFSPRPDDSFESWVTSRFGRSLYGIYFGPYTEKLWGIHPSRLSPDWASQRISVPSLSGLVRETLFPRGDKGARSLVSVFHYPRGGIGRIAEALASRVAVAGGTIITGSPPEAIRRSGTGFTIHAAGSDIEADGVVNTIPVTEYSALLGPLLPDLVRDAASHLAFRAIAFVTLRLDRRPGVGDHWIYTPEDFYRFNRLSIPENFDPAASPEGRGQVVFEYTCREGDGIWASGEPLAGECARGGERLGLFPGDAVRSFELSRQPHAYPVYERGYESISGAVLEALDALPGSVTCGRQGLFRYNNMDHSIEMGEHAALELLGEGRLRDRFDWTNSTWADG